MSFAHESLPLQSFFNIVSNAFRWFKGMELYNSSNANSDSLCLQLPGIHCSAPCLPPPPSIDFRFSQKAFKLYIPVRWGVFSTCRGSVLIVCITNMVRKLSEFLQILHRLSKFSGLRFTATINIFEIFIDWDIWHYFTSGPLLLDSSPGWEKVL